MNVELLKRIRNWIATPKPGEPNFNMGNFIYADIEPDENGEDHWCNTCCCIAGAAVVFGAGDFEARMDRALSSAVEDGRWGFELSIEDEATELLKLDNKRALSLFYDGMDAKPAHAIAVIDHLIETGEVDWGIAWKSAA